MIHSMTDAMLLLMFLSVPQSLGFHFYSHLTQLICTHPKLSLIILVYPDSSIQTAYPYFLQISPCILNGPLASFF